MSNLQYRQSKIQEKRKQTPFRDFVMEICSWYPMNLYKNKNLISRYPSTSRSPIVVSLKNFIENRDSLLEYGVMVNQISFESLFLKLFLSLPQSALFHFTDNDNCDYADSIHKSSNVYLSYTITTGCEHIFYSMNCKDSSKNVFNGYNIQSHSENIYSSSNVISGYNIFYSHYINNCSDIWFSHNLIGCSECINCNNLENQSYCINNQSYSKEDYFVQKSRVLQLKNSDISFGGFGFWINNIDCVGYNLANCSHCIDSYDSVNCINCRNTIGAISIENNENYYDVFLGGRSDGFYGILNSGSFCAECYCSIGLATCQNIYYSLHLETCSFCLGCIGLKNKSYCILNKQYTKEEWYEKVDEIFSQMEADGTLGQFFPASMNPFYFNDTAAYLIDPNFTKEEVIAKGYLRRDEPIKVDIPADAEVVKSGELERFEGFDDQGNRAINADILKKVIQDEQGNYYRIIPMEYKFLMKHGLPLPRKHRLERMKENFRIN